MLTIVIRDIQEVILIDYLGKIITGAYFANVVNHLTVALKESQPRFGNKQELHNDNASSHKSAVEMEKIIELGFKLVSHIPYSPDLFLLSNLKILLGGKKFSKN